MKLALVERRFYLPLLSFLSILGVLILWEVLIQYYKVPLSRFPAPSAIGLKIVRDYGLLLSHLSWTLVAAITGLVGAVMIAIILGGLMSYSVQLNALVYPHVMISQMIPTILISPLLILWLGFGITGKIFIVMVSAFFPMLRAFLDGIRRIDPDLIIMFKNLNASSLQIFFKLYLPYALFSLLSGLKIAVTYCVSSAMIGEFIGSEKGIGVYVQRSISTFRTDAAFAGITTVVVSTFLLYQILNVLEARIVRIK